LDFLTNGVVVITDAIKIVQNSKEKLNKSCSYKEDEKSKELEEEQVAEERRRKMSYAKTYFR
jgi:hypothetical protein